VRKTSKIEDLMQEEKRVMIWKNVTRLDKIECLFLELSKTCHDGKNVTRFQETLIQLFVTQGKKCHDLLKTWHDFGRISEPI